MQTGSLGLQYRSLGLQTGGLELQTGRLGLQTGRLGLQTVSHFRGFVDKYIVLLLKYFGLKFCFYDFFGLILV
jgi:hypothetical protein